MTQDSRRMRDERQLPSYGLMDLLQDRGAEVAYYDPWVPLIKPTREHPRSAGTQSVHWNRPTIENFDGLAYLFQKILGRSYWRS
jgi:UDP-N-acetyl-D-glucosamine dehydrogenase